MADPNLDTIINFYELSPLRGTAGQPRADQFLLISEAGYQVDINLVPSHTDGAVPHEQQIVESLGMEYFYIPVIWDSPQVEDAIRIFETLQAHQKDKVFMHCHVNYRVSSYMYVYRLRYLGIDKKQADQDLHWLWEPNPTWRDYIAKLLTTPLPGAKDV